MVNKLIFNRPIETKEVQPKIYSIFLTLSTNKGGINHLDCIKAYSSEEAVEIAMENVRKLGYTILGSKQHLYCYKTIEDLFPTEVIVEGEEPEPLIDEKDILMSEIIEDNDIARFMENEGEFNEIEKKYIRDHLKI